MARFCGLYVSLLLSSGLVQDHLLTVMQVHCPLRRLLRRAKRAILRRPAPATTTTADDVPPLPEGVTVSMRSEVMAVHLRRQFAMADMPLPSS